jgi:mono/diheme cytochrome c family protein
MKLIALTIAFAGLTAVGAGSGEAASVSRGKYLVTISGCNDCHTPGSFLGKRDVSRTLGGSEVGFEIPQLGVFVGPNLTPDKATGLGNWSTANIIKAIRTGIRPDGRQLAPIMPYKDFARLTNDDATSIAMYLKSLPPIQNKVPGPFGATEKVTTFTMKIVPPAP